MTICLATLGAACTSERPTPAETLKNRLSAAVDAGTVLFGHQDDLFYGKSDGGWKGWDGGEEHSDIRAVAGDYPAVLGVEIGGIELGNERSLDGVPFDSIRAGIAEHHRRGGIVTVSWHPANPVTGGDSWDVATAQGTVATLLDGGENQALYATWLGRVGDFLGSLRDDKGESIPVIWRPWHENAGKWFWWGASYCSSQEYVALWREMYDFLTTERGLKNLVWAVSPGFTAECTTGYTDYYPGDDYADLVGIDIYQYGTDAEYIALVREQLSRLTEFAREHGKLLALTETGSESLRNAAWWSEVLLPAVADAPIAYVLLWRNAWDRPEHYYAPFAGEASATDFCRFAADPRIGLLQACNQLK